MTSPSTGILYLIPSPICAEPDASEISERVRDALRSLNGVIAESRKSAYRFLRLARGPGASGDVPVRILNEHTKASELVDLLAPLQKGERWGLMSDAGCPAVADPGADLVRLAHEQGIRVAALAGPSSILLALMASGLNGQRFEFHGYLSRDSAARRRELGAMEEDARKTGCTHVWMETPYRNAALLDDALSCLRPSTRLCLAISLTGPDEEIRTGAVGQWRERPRPALKGRPAIFLLGPPG